MPDDETTEDPYQEPGNSTVENWHGQRVERDAERADRISAERADHDEAEERFAEEAEGPADRRGGEVD